jgi:RNA polymerase sigma-70 factor (ECF subfamily)
MLQVAQFYVSTQAVAEEVVQDTWLGVVRGLHKFEGRSSLKTWIFQILVNRAKTRGEREPRTVSFCALDGDDIGRDSDATVASGVLKTKGDAWRVAIAEEVISKELGTRIRFAIAALRPPQRAVISLRIVEGWSAVDVCALLGLSEANQRVLLHRARRAVRQALLPYLVEDQDMAR